MNDRLKIVFYIGFMLGETKRYRALNLAHYLEGDSISYFITNRVDELIGKVQYENIVLVRTAYSDKVRMLFEYSKNIGARVICDLDDLLHDEKYLPYIDGLRYYREPNKSIFINSMPLYKETIYHSDVFSSPTDYLCNTVTKKSYKIKNSLGPEALKISESVFLGKSYNNDSGVYISYYSGSLTHQADFSTCFEAIHEILKAHNNVYLRIIGDFNINEYPVLLDYVLNKRIIMVPFLSYSNMIKDYQYTDIAIAPLEIGNPFCESKSDLKYFESAACGVPLVASSTNTFSSCISNGVSGYTASSYEEWYKNLECLIKKPSLRKKIGSNARDYALKEYSYKNVGKEFMKMLNGNALRDPVNNVTLPKKKSIGLLLNTLDTNNHETEILVHIAHLLEIYGYKINVYVNDLSNISDKVQNIRNNLNYYICSDIKSIDNTGEHDYYLTKDAEIIKSLDNLNINKVVLLVCDKTGISCNFKSNKKVYLNKHLSYLDVECNLDKAPVINIPIDRNKFYPEKRDSFVKSLCILIDSADKDYLEEPISSLIKNIAEKDPYIKINVYRDSLGRSLLRKIFSNSDLGIYMTRKEINTRAPQMMACGLPVLNIKGRDISDCDPVYICNYNMMEISNKIVEIFSDYDTLLDKREKVIEYIKDNNDSIKIIKKFCSYL